MDYVKVHEMHSNASVRVKHSMPISNPCSVDISFSKEKRQITVNGKIHECYVNTNILQSYFYHISDKFHLLTIIYETECHPLTFLIEIIGDIITFKDFDGEVEYITETGFVISYFIDGCEIIDVGDHYNDQISHQYYDVITKKFSQEFKKDFYIDYLDNFNYIVVHQIDGVVSFYVPLQLWLSDTQKLYPDFNVEKYYHLPGPQKYETSEGSCTVHFKDGIQNILAEKLLCLKSEFINDQLSQDEKEIYLENFTYTEYANQTYKFLNYINSYLLHNILKKIMVRGLEEIFE